MTPEGADQAGNKLATAAMIGATLFGLASIIAAIGFLLEKLI